MKSIVTGSCGFIGSHLVEELTRKGKHVIGYDNLSRGEESIKIKLDTKPFGNLYEFIKGDILDFEKLKSVITHETEVIYHMAALPSHRLALERPHDYLMIDLAGTANVLEAARLCGAKPLIVFASSNKTYGKQKCPWKENKLPQPEGPYAVSKWASEKLCEMYNKYYDIPIVILRYHHVAGPRSNPDLALSIFTEQALKNKKIEVHGTLVKGVFESCSADYTHINDAIRATLLAAEQYQGFNIFNIANKNLTTVEYIAQKVVEYTKSESFIHAVPLLAHETLIHHSDVSRAEKVLGFTAEIPAEKAIKDYIDWRLK
jgi:nucleoside-diphosphate-sugar epimerase